MPILDVPQGSPEWFEARRGRVTSSRISRLFGSAKARQGLLEELRRERDAGPGGWMAGQGASSPDMTRGLEHEPRAAALYEFLFDSELREVGMVLHPDYPQVAASVDRLEYKSGMLLNAWECKCPRVRGHLETWTHGVPERYLAQVHFETWCTSHLIEHDAPDVGVYVSFNEEVEASRQLYRAIVPLPKDYDDRIRRALDLFIPELESLEIPAPAGPPVFF